MVEKWRYVQLAINQDQEGGTKWLVRVKKPKKRSD
jgi:hypothetical protein